MAELLIEIKRAIEEIDCDLNVTLDPNLTINRKRKIKEIYNDDSESPNNRKKFMETTETGRNTINVCVDDDDSDPEYLYKNILNNIVKLYQTKDSKMTQKFNKTLLTLSQYQHTKQKDLKFRKKAKKSMLKSMKSSRKYNKKRGDKIYNLMDKLIIKFRNHQSKVISEDDYSREWNEYIEIAIKSNKPHKEYEKIMNKLFSNVCDSNISSLICEYSRNSYLWYSFDVDSFADNNGDEDYCEYYMYNVPFSLYDHYDGKYKGETIKFDELKDDLNIKELNAMNDLEMSYFLTAIGNIVLKLEQDDIKEMVQQFKAEHC